MTDDGASHGEAGRVAGSQRVLRWASVVIASHAVGTSAAIAVLAAALRVPLARIGVPCVLLAACGVIVPGLVFWVRAARANAPSFAFRAAVASFVYLEQVAIALGASALWLGLTSLHVLATAYAPTVDVCLFALAAWVYFATRRGASRSGGTA